jgi:putative flippase GtrA
MADNKEKVKLTPKETAIQVAKFVAFSMGAGIIQTVTFTLLNELAHLNYWVSYLTALILSVLYNFTVNRRYTFKSATNVPKAMLKVAFYYLIFTPVSTVLGQMAETAGVNEYIVLAVTMLCNMATEFLVCRFWVFKDSINTNDIAEKDKSKNK